LSGLFRLGPDLSSPQLSLESEGCRKIFTSAELIKRMSGVGREENVRGRAFEP
jgi:hypothetical protein